MMTRMLVNDMKARGKGAIVNISSGSELQPLPCEISFNQFFVHINVEFHFFH